MFLGIVQLKRTHLIIKIMSCSTFLIIGITQFKPNFQLIQEVNILIYFSIFGQQEFGQFSTTTY
jgi:hypothetical protein